MLDPGCERRSAVSVHVDVVKNEWLTGEQRPIARLFVGKGELQIDSPDPARWGPVVEQALDGMKLDHPEPEEQLGEVTSRLRGSHLFATVPHDHDDCPYRGAWEPVRMESVSSSQTAADPAPA
jgi:hypothetical protein